MTSKALLPRSLLFVFTDAHIYLLFIIALLKLWRIHMLDALLTNAFTAHQLNKQKEKIAASVKTYKCSISARDKDILASILAVLPYTNSPELRIIKSSGFACFYSEDQMVIQSIQADFNGLQAEFETRILIGATDIQWLSRYLEQTEIYGAHFST